jgi:hypothetical protein
MKSMVLILVLLASRIASALPCEDMVNDRAAKLLALHNEISLEQAATELSGVITEVAPLKAPNGKGHYSVFETDGIEGKSADYRIRMIIWTGNHNDACVLMGQEILEMSSLN